MGSVASWISATKATNLWDRIFLNGEEVPCDRVTVDGFDTGRQLDIKGRKGEDGADYTDNGFEPASGSITLEWYTAESAAAGELVLEKFEPRSKGTLGTPISITHPCPNENGVERVIVKKKGAPVVRNGIRSRKLELVEYLPAAPKKAGGPKKSTAVGYGSVEDDNQAVTDEYNRRMQEIADDADAGRLTDEEVADAAMAANEDYANQQRDLYAAANDDPASQSNIDGRSL